jgi:hypothetical protein
LVLIDKTVGKTVEPAKGLQAGTQETVAVWMESVELELQVY